MLHSAIILFLAIVLFVLVRRGLVQVDMSFPWFIALLVLGFFSTVPDFVADIAQVLGILYPPIAILLLTNLILFGLVMALQMGLTVIRARQVGLVRRVAALELSLQEQGIIVARET